MEGESGIEVEKLRGRRSDGRWKRENGSGGK